MSGSKALAKAIIDRRSYRTAKTPLMQHLFSTPDFAAAVPTQLYCGLETVIIFTFLLRHPYLNKKAYLPNWMNNLLESSYNGQKNISPTTSLILVILVDYRLKIACFEYQDLIIQNMAIFLKYQDHTKLERYQT